MIQSVLNNAKSYIGMKQGDKRHKDMVEKYNAVRPLPVGYSVKFTDDWCAVFVTAIADNCAVSQYVGRECGVQRFVSIFKNKGIWLGLVKPEPGDIIVFDWQKNGWSDHIGFVEQVNGNKVTTIEGNTSRSVARRTYAYNDWRVSGYARPKYPGVVTDGKKTVEEIALEVISGLWGNGLERVGRLKKAGYNPQSIQHIVNEQVSDGKPSVKTNGEIAGEVIQGKWGNGQIRKNVLWMQDITTQQFKS